jgi:hypothetical protein
VVAALASSASAGASSPLDPLVANADCLHVLNAWLDDGRAACVAAGADAAHTQAAEAEGECVALLTALLKLPITVKVSARREPARATRALSGGGIGARKAVLYLERGREGGLRRPGRARASCGATIAWSPWLASSTRIKPNSRSCAA